MMIVNKERKNKIMITDYQIRVPQVNYFPKFFKIPTAQNLIEDLNALVITQVLPPNGVVGKKYMDYIAHLLKSCLDNILFESDFRMIGLGVLSYRLFIEITNHSTTQFDFKVYIILDTHYEDSYTLEIPYLVKDKIINH